jgi:anti-sigma factor RsiW
MTPTEKKTTCAWFRDRIDSFIDGELDTDELSVFETHSASCPSCREELELAQRVTAGLRDLPSQRCPDSVTDGVFGTIEPVHRQGPRESFLQRFFDRRGGLLRPAITGVALLIVIVSTVLIGRIRNGMEAVPPAEIARAEAELKWTLAYVGDLGRRTGLTVRNDVLGERVVEPMRRAVHTAIDGGSAATTHNNGGS